MTVDLRSDTVTKPTQEMREAMAVAEVGDDVFGEDPTVQKLEEEVSRILAKEAGLFVPSGVMGNQIAIAVHSSPGDEVVLAERSHIFHYESGAAGHISGVQLRPVGDLSGILTAEDIRGVIQGAHAWEARTSLVCLENTINKSGGRIYPINTITEVAGVVREHGLAFHLDGARLWNASVELGVSETEITAPFDSVTVCLSKALGAPVGSVLVGSGKFVAEARRMRKRLGGGMRQVGILAAAGLVALTHKPALKDDHERARTFAEALRRYEGLDVVAPETNIVLFHAHNGDAPTLISRLAKKGILLSQFGHRTVRATFHRDITSEDLTNALDVFEELFS
ncbi:MAG: GntG family PLP-dependent aldolase [Rubricoccaceae bacterium]|nr:GntG family PLP-dependent aldolase [Rubricoccaceae bacterium]